MADMHRMEEFRDDMAQFSDGFPGYEIMLEWYFGRYSTSKHLLALYSLAKGLKAKNILEVGFGRSTFILARAANENGGRLTTCDRYDYSELINGGMADVTTHVVGDAKKVMRDTDEKYDLIFLDYLSSRERSSASSVKAVRRALKILSDDGVICVHDTAEDYYFVWEAIAELEKDKKLNVFTMPYNYGMTLIQRAGQKHHKRKEEWSKE